jgi:hypothetical protein
MKFQAKIKFSKCKGIKNLLFKKINYESDFSCQFFEQLLIFSIFFILIHYY